MQSSTVEMGVVEGSGGGVMIPFVAAGAIELSGVRLGEAFEVLGGDGGEERRAGGTKAAMLSRTDREHE